MARPNAPKDMKPTDAKAEAKANGGGGGSKVIIINVITTAIICTLFLLATYFMQDSLLSKKLPKDGAATEDSADAGAGDNADNQEEKGIIVDLGDFTMNLSDPGMKRYLKVSVALELSKKPSDDEAAGGKGGEGGEGGKAAASPIESEMAQYKPAIRDAIISSLSSKTSSELSTTAGKELAKGEITDSVDSILGGDREVIRVSFGEFIMQ